MWMVVDDSEKFGFCAGGISAMRRAPAATAPVCSFLRLRRL